MESNLVESCLGELGGPFGPERNTCVHVQVKGWTKLCLQGSNPLKRSLSGHQRVTSGNPGTCSPHSSGFLDNLVKVLAASLVGEHVVDVATSLRKRTVIAAPVAVPGDEQDQFTSHLTLDASL